MINLLNKLVQSKIQSVNKEYLIKQIQKIPQIRVRAIQTSIPVQLSKAHFTLNKILKNKKKILINCNIKVLSFYKKIKNRSIL